MPARTGTAGRVGRARAVQATDSVSTARSTSIFSGRSLPFCQKCVPCVASGSSGRAAGYAGLWPCCRWSPVFGSRRSGARPTGQLAFSEITISSRHRVGGHWGKCLSSQVRGHMSVHSACVAVGHGGGSAVDSGPLAASFPADAPCFPGVVLCSSQACPQRCPQPVCTDSDRQHCYVLVHPDRACCLIRLVSSVTWL